MKGKGINLDKIKQLGIAHVEKVVFGVFVIAVFWGMLSVIQSETYDKAPEDLSRQVDTLQQQISQNVPELPEVKPPMDFDEEFPKREQLLVDDIALAGSKEGAFTVERKLWEGAKRPAPEMFPPNSFEVFSGFDGFNASVEVAPGEEKKTNDVAAKYYAIVTGVVPRKKQITTFHSLYRDCKIPTPDEPEYLTYFIQKADVTNGDPPQWENFDPQQVISNPVQSGWKTAMALRIFENLKKDWIIDEVTKVAESMASPIYTSPLPKIMAREWGSEITTAKFPLEQTEEASKGPEPEKKPAGDGTNPFGLPGTKKEEEKPAAAKVIDPDADHLFRFIDFDVLPNHRYVYRFQFILKNPNYNIGVQFLASEDLAKGTWVLSPWSEATSPVLITKFSRILAGPATPATYTSEATISLMIQQQHPEFGVPVSFIFDKIKRGTVCNFHEDNVPFEDPKSGARMTGPVSFMSNCLLLDIRGGDKLPPRTARTKMIEPGEALLIDANGQLIVRNELLDFDAWTKEEDRVKKIGGNKAAPAQGNGNGGNLPAFDFNLGND